MRMAAVDRCQPSQQPCWGERAERYWHCRSAGTHPLGKARKQGTLQLWVEVRARLPRLHCGLRGWGRWKKGGGSGTPLRLMQGSLSTQQGTRKKKAGGPAHCSARGSTNRGRCWVGQPRVLGGPLGHTHRATPTCRWLLKKALRRMSMAVGTMRTKSLRAERSGSSGRMGGLATHDCLNLMLMLAAALLPNPNTQLPPPPSPARTPPQASRQPNSPLLPSRQAEPRRKPGGAVLHQLPHHPQPLHSYAIADAGHAAMRHHRRLCPSHPLQ